MQLYINHTTKRMKGKFHRTDRKQVKEESSSIPYLFGQLADSLLTPVLFLVCEEKYIYEVFFNFRW